MLFTLLLMITSSILAGGSHYTKGHFTRSGKYVSGHYSTNPDKDHWNNYSSTGNINPNTGKVGKKSTMSTHMTNTGSRGGQYYINSKGRKTYVSH